MIRTKLLLNSTQPVFSNKITTSEPSGHCYVCGNEGVWESAPIINDELAQTWGIDDTLRTAFDARESMFCTKCSCSFRLRQLAECLTTVYGEKSLVKLVKNNEFAQKPIAEINSCGKMHEVLQDLQNLSYSEYKSEDKSIRSENLENLTYDNETFDLVLTSDTLEHVPDIRKALTEISRVLKPGGKHIFTVPVVWNRLTRNRTDHEPSYHGAGQPDYLVFNEFGHDIINIVKGCGFSVKVFKINVVNLNDVSGVIVATK